MRKLPETCVRRPVFASMIILSMVVVGGVSYFRLGVDRNPSVDIPTVSVTVTLRGASAEEMETEVAQKLENAINTVEGIDELRSMCGPGTCLIMVTFNLNRDIDAAAQDVRDRVNNVLRDLPDDTDPPVVAKVDNDSDAILTMALAGNRSLRELTELADKVVRTQLERSPGVGRVYLRGGLSRAINVWISADRLAAYQLSIADVYSAIQRQNINVAGGNVTGPVHEVVLRTVGRYTDAAAFNDLVITTINGVPIRIRDIGLAEDGVKEQRSIARLNGVPTVILAVQRQARSNTIEVIRAARENLRRIQEQLPPDVKLQIIRDQSRYIFAALHEINVHLVLGSIFASLVVLLFMKSWRSTVIAAVAIPASVIATFGMMWALNFTLNSVTMLALVLMVGVVIDDAIVVLENVFRFVEEKKLSPFEAAIAATSEIAFAVLATTLSLVVIFVPVSFMSSVSGRFLYQFGITAAVAVMVSMVVSFVLTPMMCSRMLRGEDASAEHARALARSRRGFYRIIDTAYAWMLRKAMRFRFVTLLLGAAIMATSIPLYQAVKQEFLPSDVDEGEFSVNVFAPEGTSVAAMNEAMLAVEQEIRSIPGVQTVLATAGGGWLGAVNMGSAHVELVPHKQRIFSLMRLARAVLAGDPDAAFRGNVSQAQVMQEVRARLRKYRDLRCQVRAYPPFNLGGGNFDVDFVIRGPDLQTLYNLADHLRRRILEDNAGDGPLKGIVDPDITLKLDKPELHVEIDRFRAADLGIDARDIGVALRLMVGGEAEVSRFHDPSINEDYDVDLRLIEGQRNDPAAIAALHLPRRGGGLVQLANVATVRQIDSASRIDRVDRQRTVRLRAFIAPGYALGDRLDALRAEAAKMDFPPGYSTRISGRGRELERTFTEFLWAFLLSVVFMYMILASLFESTVHPFTILLSLPLSLPFALLSLWYTDGRLNLYSALGMLVLFGVVKKNAILQIDHMNGLRRNGMPRMAAIMQANRDRLRPILMTTLAFVAGMIPLAVGTGPGAEERRAVAIVVIGGQTLSLLLTLLMTPVVYSLLDDVSALMARWRTRRSTRHEDVARGGSAHSPAPTSPVMQPARLQTGGDAGTGPLLSGQPDCR